MKRENIKKLGVVIGVDGDISEVGMYEMSNDTNIFWHGEELIGPKIGAYLTIHQNDIKIIATVVSEKIIDQQNTVQSQQFDNRYTSDSINRIIKLKTQGVIENNKFKITSQYVPMIGNEVTVTTKDSLNIIYGISKNSDIIHIGNSLLEHYPINIPVNKFFASHIGIFGNTGSGKSNTLHKLYLELFRKYDKGVLRKSKFFIIDFNGEYTANGMFGVDNKDKDKKIYKLNTRLNKEENKKLPVLKNFIEDPNILAMLLSATPATQIPFLRNALKYFKKSEIEKPENFAAIEVGFLKKMLEKADQIDKMAFSNWASIIKEINPKEEYYSSVDRLTIVSFNTGIAVKDELTNHQYSFNGDIKAYGDNFNPLAFIEELKTKVNRDYSQLSPIRRLELFLEYEILFQIVWKKNKIEYLAPLSNRVKDRLNDLDKVFEVTSKENNINFVGVNIISLVDVNQSLKLLVPMILAKMIYEENKKINAGKTQIQSTTHLIIDEAHNILNISQQKQTDSWQDYRLSIFEEIIKEGRKFGFFLTLSSQRPADISPTIMSQLHNYFIHRLVNEIDLRMLSNTMPTLDINSLRRIPSLGQGEAIITGNAIKLPILVKIDKEIYLHPTSDDVKLTDLWNNLYKEKL